MAGVALVATVLVVCVVLKVTRYASLVHLVLERVFRMAVTAGKFCMATQQIKFGIA